MVVIFPSFKKLEKIDKSLALRKELIEANRENKVYIKFNTH